MKCVCIIQYMGVHHIPRLAALACPSIIRPASRLRVSAPHAHRRMRRQQRRQPPRASRPSRRRRRPPRPPRRPTPAGCARRSRPPRPTGPSWRPRSRARPARSGPPTSCATSSAPPGVLYKGTNKPPAAFCSCSQVWMCAPTSCGRRASRHAHTPGAGPRARRGRAKHREEVARLKAELGSVQSSSKGGQQAVDRTRKDLDKTKCAHPAWVRLSRPVRAPPRHACCRAAAAGCRAPSSRPARGGGGMLAQSAPPVERTEPALGA